MKFLHFCSLRTNIEAQIPILQHLQVEYMCSLLYIFKEFNWIMLTINYSFCSIHHSVTYAKMLVVSNTLQMFFTCSYTINLKFLLYPLSCMYSLTCVRLYNALIVAYISKYVSVSLIC